MNRVFLLEYDLRGDCRSDVQAALLLLRAFPPPAPCAHVLARTHRPRARRAADRAVALVVEPVVGHAMLAEISPHIRLAPRRQRIEFLKAVDGVEFLLGELRAPSRLLAPLTRDPGAFAGECQLERLDLAQLATALAQVHALVEGVPAVLALVFHERRAVRPVDKHVDPIVAADL